MKRFRTLLAAIAASGALAGCSAGSTGAPPITQVNPSSPTYSKLQFAVGTANIYGDGLIALNVVSTLRQPNGTSALGVDTPTITGPFAFTGGVGLAAPAVGGSLPDPYTTLFSSSGGPVGPSLAEAGSAAPQITGTPQTIHPGTPFCDYVGTLPSGANSSATFTVCPGAFTPDASTFGQSGGVFAMGFAPYNHVASTGQAYSYAPYAQPLYDNGSTHPTFIPWGGPPAFDPDANGMGTRDGLIPLGADSFGLPFALGVAEGITVFEGVTPKAGTYTLSVQIPAIGNSGSANISTVSAQAPLKSLALLPTVTAPTVTPDANGDGGLSVAVTIPGGITQAYVQIVDFGPGAGPGQMSLTAPNCQGPKGTSFAPVYYTLEVTATGTYQLGSSHGPNSNLSGGINNLTPTPTICTAAQNNAQGFANAGDNFTVQLIGFDYPVYQAALSLTQPNTPQAPAITGGAGQSDVTISLPVEEVFTSGAYVRTPLRSVSRPFRVRR